MLSRQQSVDASSRELHEPSCRRIETAGVDVERPEILIESNMEELATSGTCSVPRHMNEPHADAPASIVGVDHDILDERMHQAVPQHVHEPRETTGLASDHPAEAVAFALGDPVPFRFVKEPGLERCCVQRMDLAIRE